MRTTTEIDEVSGVAVDADRLSATDLGSVVGVGCAGGDPLDDLALVRLIGEQAEGVGR